MVRLVGAGAKFADELSRAGPRRLRGRRFKASWLVGCSIDGPALYLLGIAILALVISFHLRTSCLSEFLFWGLAFWCVLVGALFRCFSSRRPQ